VSVQERLDSSLAPDLASCVRTHEMSEDQAPPSEARAVMAGLPKWRIAAERLRASVPDSSITARERSAGSGREVPSPGAGDRRPAVPVVRMASEA
jgi:hypothetical protein